MTQIFHDIRPTRSEKTRNRRPNCFKFRFPTKFFKSDFDEFIQVKSQHSFGQVLKNMKDRF